MGIIIAVAVVGFVAFILLHNPDNDARRRENIKPLTTDEFSPDPINLTAAKKIYRQYILSTGLYDKEDVAEGARMLGEEIKCELDMLKDEITEQKNNIRETQAQIKTIKAEQKTTSDETDAQEEIEELKGEIADYKEDLELASKQYTALKADKKTFLIDYINKEIQS